MNPWLLAGGAAALLALFAASSGTSASTDQMVFKDYAWVTQLPTYTGPGGDPANPLARELPPPPNVTAPGQWRPFPQGAFVAGISDPTFHSAKYAPGAPAFEEWPGAAPGVTVWMWVPTIGGVHGSTANVTMINGYYVSFEVPWDFAVSAQEAAALGMSQAQIHAFEAATGPISPTNRVFWTHTWPPPPPGQTSKSGHWIMKHPGYMVWITPQNATKGDPEMAALALSAQFNLGAMTPAVPVGVPGYPGAVPPGVPQPSPTPIAVTPPAQPAPLA